MIEIWKDIEGYEGLYQISNFGKVKSLKRFRNNGTNGYFQKEKILKSSMSNGGYLSVNLYKCNTKKQFTVHRLVAIHFISQLINSDEKLEVNHKDGNKSNNCFKNLEWCTSSENKIHALKNNFKIPLKGEFNASAKITQQQVNEIRKKYIPRKYTTKMLALEYGISQQHISEIINYKSWK